MFKELIAETISWKTSDLDFKERGAFSQLELTVLEAEHYKVGLTYTSASLNRAYQDHYIYDRDLEEDTDLIRYTMVPPPTSQFALGCVATIFDIYARKSEPVFIREDAPHPASVTGEDSAGENASFDMVLAIVSAVLLAL
ncbi:unnamed protein product [Danaus chrysippus]|uniref:(African queen) hypothetical protein n=1 Tax=Danaus chrysippus TaxID=151541 RepID=A0A8J2QRQ8_9NEOP|nr:unnamed protein product [Danaus chrysippus]